MKQGLADSTSTAICSPRFAATDDARQRGDKAGRAGDQLRRMTARQQRRTVGRANGEGDTGQRLDQRIGAMPVPIRPRGSNQVSTRYSAPGEALDAASLEITRSARPDSDADCCALP
jgi:hypothetical protein